MQVISIRPRGFCPGVARAIQLVEQALSDPSVKRPVYILGMIVHNAHVVRDLEKKGAVTLDVPGKTRLELLDSISHGTVVITAHGASLEVLDQIKAKGLDVIDATCKDVYRTHDAIKKHLQSNEQVLFIGKRHHPETEAILAISSKIILIDPSEPSFHFAIGVQPVYVTNQTTLSQLELERIFNQLRQMAPDLLIENELCDSTRIRQAAILAHNQAVDLCYIVGDPRSNNTRSLVELSIEKTHTPTYLIENVADINPRDLVNVKRVSVSSGASTPPTLTEEVIDFLRHYSKEGQ